MHAKKEAHEHEPSHGYIPAPEVEPVTVAPLPLAAGDHVTLEVVGCPVMTVVNVTPTGDCQCRWFDAGGFHDVVFHRSELTRAAAPRGHGPHVTK